MASSPGNYPRMANPAGEAIDDGVIVKPVATNICGSDQHMVRGRTTAPEGLVLGHEITGEIVQKGSDVEFLEVGDLVSVPFNVACGRCRTCREGSTGICLTMNSARPGGACGYVDMDGWVGGQAEYVLVPYADFNLLKFPDRDRAMEKILDLTSLSDPPAQHSDMVIEFASRKGREPSKKRAPWSDHSGHGALHSPRGAGSHDGREA